MRVALRCFVLVLVAACMAGCTLDKPTWLDQKRANEAEASFYVEQTWEGRLYAFGTSAAHRLFQTTHELQYSKGFIGAGVNGETVCLELDPKNPALLNRVRSEYEDRHGELED